MENRSVLWELYHGQLYPAANIRPKKEEYREAVHRTSVLSQEMHGVYSAGDWDLFERYQLADCEVQNYLQEATFIEGFRLGALIVLELMKEGETWSC